MKTNEKSNFFSNSLVMHTFSIIDCKSFAYRILPWVNVVKFYNKANNLINQLSSIIWINLENQKVFVLNYKCICVFKYYSALISH